MENGSFFYVFSLFAACAWLLKPCWSLVAHSVAMYGGGCCVVNQFLWKRTKPLASLRVRLGHANLAIKYAVGAWVAGLALSAQAQVGPTCDGRLWLTQDDTLYRVDSSTNPFTFPVVTVAPFQMNAVDINPGNGNLYGIIRPTNRLFRINSAGAAVDLGVISGLPAGGYVTAGFSNVANILYVTTPSIAVMYAVNVITLTATAIPLSEVSDVADIAWFDGFFWGTGSGQLRRISVTGTITTIAASGYGGFGSMYGASNGLFGSSNAGGFFQVDPEGGGITLLSDSPSAAQNDGAHCNTQPVSLAADRSVTKTNTPASGANDLANDTYLLGFPRTYTIVVSNSGPFGVSLQRVQDTLPTGITDASYTCTASASSTCGTAASGSVSGVSQITWTGVGLPVNGTISIQVTLTVPANYSGNLVNTVTVLPSTTAIDGNTANDTAVDSDIANVSDLSITKTNNLPGTVDLANDTLARGQSTVYRIVVTNSGPHAANGAVVRDTATGLACTGLTCTSSPASPSACPASAPTAAQLLGPSGVTLQNLPVGGSVSLDLTCTVN